MIAAMLLAAAITAIPGLAPDVFDGKASFSQPVDLSRMAPATDGQTFADPISFEGRLTLTPQRPDGYKILANDHQYGLGNASDLAPPPFDLAFVQDGGRLYPVNSGILNPGGSGWEVLAGPGYIWNDGSDGGRVSFSLTLKEPNANCLHNGILTLRFDHSGLKPVALYEVFGETCSYFKFNLWGTMRVAFTPGTPADKAGLVAQNRDIANHRLAVKPLSALGVTAGPDIAKPFGKDISDDPPTSYGFAVGDTLYAGDCVTRLGVNPLCADTDLPSFSTAKSIFAAVAVMRAEALYPGIKDTTIQAAVPACAWGDVTLLQTLDMATGRYNSAAYEADEDSDDMAGFFAPPDHAGKLAFACGHYPHQAAPGTQFVYHTADTYALGTALQALYRQKTHGQEIHGDVYNDLVAPLWHGLHLSQRLDFSERSHDADAQPMTGFGLIYRRDDIVRIARWLADDAPSAEGPGLDRTLLDEALQRRPDHRGLIAFPPNYRYQHGFWARNIAPVVGCAHEVWVPFMSGFGGITVAMMPNGVTFYYFGDDQQFDWTRAITVSNTVKALCS